MIRRAWLPPPLPNSAASNASLPEAELAYEPSRKRIMMLASTLARGGCERQILSTATGLIEKGYQVSVVALARAPAGDNLEAEFTEHSISPRYVDEYGLTQENEGPSGSAMALPDDMRKYVAGVKAAILDHRPYVLHAWSDYAAIVGGMVALSLSVPRVVVGQRNVSPPSHLGENIETYQHGYRILASCPHVVLTNNSARNAREYERWLSLPTGTIVLHRNGLLPSTVRSPSPLVARLKRRDLGIPEGAKVVGSLMRFVDQKDPALWLATAEQIARGRDDVIFVLGGYGELKDKIVSEARALGLSHRFVLMDGTTDLGIFYALLDIFLMTSRFEGTPNVLIEAQAAMCPIVTTDAGGIRETVADGLTARIVTNRSAATLAATVLETLADDRWRRQAGTAGPSFVRRQFGHSAMIAQTLRLYYPPAFIGPLLAFIKGRWMAR